MTEPRFHPIRSYVFVTTEPGQTASVVEQIRALEVSSCAVLRVDRVIGEFDIIAQLETPDIDCLAGAITGDILELPGVVKVVASWCLDLAATPDNHAPVRREQSLVLVC
jgi:DNA-binding Lrp family transcriptional regulator